MKFSSDYSPYHFHGILIQKEHLINPHVNYVGHVLNMKNIES